MIQFEGHDSKDIPTGQDGSHIPGGFSDADYEDVKQYLAPFSFVEVIKGRIQDRVDALPETQFNLVHIDTDLAIPTYFSLTYFGERMAKGGIIIVDDYNFVTTLGVRKAVDKYMSEQKRADLIFFSLESGQGMIVRI